jgi:hypothetical protein
MALDVGRPNLHKGAGKLLIFFDQFVPELEYVHGPPAPSFPVSHNSIGDEVKLRTWLVEERAVLSRYTKAADY